ncbi:VOC family protein [Paenibacillus eucommiae]|uniref:Catechol 2,3-dioxygenase-like lactoylglutathione lyase family enzyme n=1 Tax=Paenibacillus eucommiae TaxID=1355755 RepID=A0ABS4J6H7_9BACL|nr:VOC family protein [Paenibacillus eucommiae]MBP1994861.1 catechol 2,3-dioxygenase-like lactoylglutathione lyase family enzyme [Paenibacillus eucommiae]
MSESKSFLEEIHYFRIPVTDLEGSIHWYANVLRLTLRRQTEGRAVFAVGEGPLLVIVKADADSRGHFLINGTPEFSVGFTCPDIHDFRDYLREEGVQVDAMQEEGGHYYFHFYDPSGNKLQAHW